MQKRKGSWLLDNPLHIVTYLFGLTPILLFVIDYMVPPPTYFIGTNFIVIFLCLIVNGTIGLFSLIKDKEKLRNLTLLLASILFGMLFVEYLAEFKHFVSPNITFAFGGLIASFLTSLLEGKR